MDFNVENFESSLSQVCACYIPVPEEVLSGSAIVLLGPSGVAIETNEGSILLASHEQGIVDFKELQPLEGRDSRILGATSSDTIVLSYRQFCKECFESVEDQKDALYDEWFSEWHHSFDEFHSLMDQAAKEIASQKNEMYFEFELYPYSTSLFVSPDCSISDTDIFHHGSDADLSEFSPELSSRDGTFWLTPDVSDAQTYGAIIHDYSVKTASTRALKKSFLQRCNGDLLTQEFGALCSQLSVPYAFVISHNGSKDKGVFLPPNLAFFEVSLLNFEGSNLSDIEGEHEEAVELTKKAPSVAFACSQR